MSATCPIGFDSDRLLSRIRATYAQVAEQPESGFHFRTGAHYAIVEIRSMLDPTMAPA